MLLGRSTSHLARPSTSFILPKEVIVIPETFIRHNEFDLSVAVGAGASAVPGGTRIDAAVSLDRRSN
jgi:hypothetical protein